MRLKKEYFILAGVLVVLILYLVLHHSNRTHYKLPDITARKTDFKDRDRKGRQGRCFEQKK